MIRALVIEPHFDDAVLFACYTLISERAFVMTVFGEPNEKQPGTRQREHQAAMDFLEVGYTNGTISDSRWTDRQVEEYLAAVLVLSPPPDVIYAPAWEEGGHEQHNLVAELTQKVLGELFPIVSYMTYTRGGRRSRGSIEVEPEHGWSALKFQAMACYASQIEWVQTRPWFAADDALREWLA